MSSAEGEEREIAMERSRAARRAAVAAAKLVASPAALASLEPVQLSTLSGDDRSEYMYFFKGILPRLTVHRLHNLLQRIRHQESGRKYRMCSPTSQVQTHIRRPLPKALAQRLGQLPILP